MGRRKEAACFTAEMEEDVETNSQGERERGEGVM